MKHIKSCLGMLVLLVAGLLVAAFVGSVVISQTTTVPTFAARTAQPPQATATGSRLQPTAGDGGSASGSGSSVSESTLANNAGPAITATPGDDQIQVSITTPLPTNTPDNAVQITTTTAQPSLGAPDAALGTLGYPLTVTAEAHIAATKVNAFYDSVDATRTAAAIRIAPTIVAMTATAAAKHK